MHLLFFAGSAIALLVCIAWIVDINKHVKAHSTNNLGGCIVGAFIAAAAAVTFAVLGTIAL